MKTLGTHRIFESMYASQSNGGQTGPYSVLTSSDYKETFGVKTPGYYALVRSKKLIPPTYFTQFRSVGSVSGSAEQKRKSNNLVTSYPFPHQGSGWVVYPSDIDLKLDRYKFDHLVQAAGARIYEKSHDSLTFLAELAKLVLGFRGLLERFMKLLREPDLKKFGKAWLEGRYQWRTLLFDIIDISQSFASLQDRRTRFSERIGMTFMEQEVIDELVDYGDVTFHRRFFDSYSFGVRGSVSADIEMLPFRFNLVTTSWELIPFSFVVDWFFSVGKALSAMSLSLLSSKVVAAGGYYVTLHRDIVIGDYTLVNTTDFYYYTFEGSGSLDVSRTLRIPTSVSTIPLINVRFDEFKMLDALALLRQLLR